MAARDRTARQETTPEAGTYRLMYRSRSKIPPEQRRAELGRLFSQAREKNKRIGLTGALLLDDEWFVQVLEGSESTIRHLFAQIELDPRHEAVALVESGGATGRVFARWAMARISDDGEPDIPLIASDRRGVVEAATRRTTAEQEELLARMRDAARSGSTAG
jgi:hypothetical protein